MSETNYFRPSGFAAHDYDFYQWTPYAAHGLYESNYLHAHSPDGRLAIWIKHNILATPRDAKPPVLELRAVLFERGLPPIALGQVLPLKSMSMAEGLLGLKGPNVLLMATQTRSKIEDQLGRMEWEIDITPSDEPAMIHLPYAWMYRAAFPKKKLLTPMPHGLFNGALRLTQAGQTREILMHNWIGFRGHNWGTEHAHSYAYGNCNDFPAMPDLRVDGFSVRLKMAGLLTPWLSPLLIRHQGRDHALNGLMQSWRSRCQVNFPEWRVCAKSPAGDFEWLQRAAPESFVGLIYRHPNGRVAYCYNSKAAHSTLRHTQAGRVLWEAQSDAGELEFLFHTPLPGIPLHG